jgi:hypothetical protein
MNGLFVFGGFDLALDCIYAGIETFLLWIRKDEDVQLVFEWIISCRLCQEHCGSDENRIEIEEKLSNEHLLKSLTLILTVLLLDGFAFSASYPAWI